MADEQSENSRVPENFREHVFKPGESGNPGGRPKGSVSLKTALQDKLRDLVEDAPAGQERTYAQAVVEATIRDAIAGDSQSRKLVWEYMEGKPHSSMSLDVDIVPIVDDVPREQ